MDVYEFGLVGQWIQFSEKVSPRCGLYLEWKHNNTVTNDIQSHNRSDSNDESEKGSGSPPNSVRSKHVTEGDGEFDLRGKIDPLVHILEM